MANDSMQDWRLLESRRRHGSISSGSEQFDIDPATAGRILERLESQVGMSFFVHRARPFRLTSDGRDALDRMLPVLARTAFKTWATMLAKYQHPCWPDGIVEAAMDHFEPKYNGAYLRQMPVEEMREVLDVWGRFCFSKVKRNGAMPACRI